MESKDNIKKIAVIGPESTGKSTLCNQLALHFQTLWVREYAREYLEENGKDYVLEDLYRIAQGQLAGEDVMNYELRIKNYGQAVINNERANPQLLFIDTDLHVIKIWSEFVFNKIDNRILTEIARREYDLFLLCDVDLPWVKDELREYPDPALREKLFHYYKEEMTEQLTPWVIIRGDHAQRLASAIDAVNTL